MNDEYITIYAIIPSYLYKTKELTSEEYKVSYRKEHPELIVDHVKNIKGIMVEPGFGKFVKRQQIMKLDKNIKF